jgi:hypothetical protein
MRKLVVIATFFLSIALHSQDYIVKDTLKHENLVFNYEHLSFGKTSFSKFFKVIICHDKDFEMIKKKIISCKNTEKSEFTEFYLLAIPDLSKNQIVLILNQLLNKIDNYRMEQNLETALIKCKLDIKRNQFTYQLDQPKQAVSSFKNFVILYQTSMNCSAILY